MDTQLGQEPCADQGTDNPDCDIADETKSEAHHKLSGQPTGNETYQ